MKVLQFSSGDHGSTIVKAVNGITLHVLYAIHPHWWGNSFAVCTVHKCSWRLPYFIYFLHSSFNHSFNLTGQRVCKKLWNCSQFQFIHALNHLQRLLKNSNSKGIFYKTENKKGTRWDGYTIHCRKQNLHMSSIVCQQRIRFLFIASINEKLQTHLFLGVKIIWKY